MFECIHTVCHSEYKFTLKKCENVISCICRPGKSETEWNHDLHGTACDPLVMGQTFMLVHLEARVSAFKCACTWGCGSKCYDLPAFLYHKKSSLTMLAVVVASLAILEDLEDHLA